jgi:hypothetical protein
MLMRAVAAGCLGLLATAAAAAKAKPGKGAAGVTLLQPRAYEPVLLKDVTPHSWLLSQLRIQANGLSGILDQFWPQVSESVWIGHRYATFAGGERATYWLNGQVPLHHLLANADPTSPEALRTGASVRKYMSYIVAHQDPSGWLGPGANSSKSAPLLWARYYLLYAFAHRAEATHNLTLRNESIGVMLRHVHASARTMVASGFYDAPDGGWSMWRMHEYLLVLQWLLENAPPEETAFLMEHAVNASKPQERAGWEVWFSRWDSPHCPATAPTARCPSPSTGVLPPLPPPPPSYELFKAGVFCCDQSHCTKDKRGHDHSTFLGTFKGTFAQCFEQCDARADCHFVTKSKPHGGDCGACFLSEFCNRTGGFIPFHDPSGKLTNDRANTYVKKRQKSNKMKTSLLSPVDQAKRGWPRCGMITHGVNTAQAIKSAAVMWRLSGNSTLKALSNQRMASLDAKYGVATGLVCADESLCGPPDAPEAERKSPSRGTELCAVVESMFSYNEMFSILGGVADADRAERIALNALSATWASPRGGDMWCVNNFRPAPTWHTAALALPRIGDT